MKPHPQITFVDHKEIFQDASHLPTFNSQAIEAHLHRIPNLAERYIYLNDDFIFISPVKEKDFYDQNGRIKVFFGSRMIEKNESKSKKIAYYSSLHNTDRFLDTFFGYQTRREITHAPYVMNKTVVRACEAAYPEIFSSTSSHPFRSKDDFTLTNGLIPYYALYKGFAVEGKLRTGMLFIGLDKVKNKSRLQGLKRKKWQMVCVEDAAMIDDPVIDAQVSDALRRRFPRKAPWEK